jgi:hypothetical protein
MSNETYLIPEALLKAVHDYLMNRPMREVEPLVTALRALEPQKKPE